MNLLESSNLGAQFRLQVLMLSYLIMDTYDLMGFISYIISQLGIIMVIPKLIHICLFPTQLVWNGTHRARLGELHALRSSHRGQQFIDDSFPPQHVGVELKMGLFIRHSNTASREIAGNPRTKWRLQLFFLVEIIDELGNFPLPCLIAGGYVKLHQLPHVGTVVLWEPAN